MARCQPNLHLEAADAGSSSTRSRVSIVCHAEPTPREESQKPEPTSLLPPISKVSSICGVSVLETKVEGACGRSSGTTPERDAADIPAARRDSVAVLHAGEPKPGFAQTGEAPMCQAVEVVLPIIQPERKPKLVKRLPLQRPIHPLFRRDRFPPDVKYDLIFPALQLAWRLLEIPTATYFLHAIFWGFNEAIPDDPRGFEVLHAVRAMHDLTTLDYERVYNELAAMSVTTEYEIRETKPHEHFTGKTTFMINHHTGGRNKSAHLITIPRKLLRALERPWCTTANARREALFCLAAVVVHEIAHAAQGWATGGCRPEDYFERATMTKPEVGEEMERQIFGGRLVFPVERDYTDNQPVVKILLPDGSDTVIELPIDTVFICNLLADDAWDEIFDTKAFYRIVPYSVRKWSRLSEATGQESGLPGSLERLCSRDRRLLERHSPNPLGHDFVNRRLVAQKSPHNRCCIYSQGVFELWAARQFKATCEDLERWRLCLWWLRPVGQTCENDLSSSDPSPEKRWGIAPDGLVLAEVQTHVEAHIDVLRSWERCSSDCARNPDACRLSLWTSRLPSVPRTVVAAVHTGSGEETVESKGTPRRSSL